MGYYDEENEPSVAKKIIIAIVVVVILLILGVIGFYTYSFITATEWDNTVGKPCPCGNDSWCNESENICYETCTPLGKCKDASLIPRIGAQCHYINC